VSARLESAAAGIAPRSWAAWLLAFRPKTLGAAVVPVAIGSACAQAAGGLRPALALAALAVALALQIAANLVNDAADFERGADGSERLGPARAAQSRLLTPGELKAAALCALAVALALGVYLASVAGPIVVVLGASSMIAALAYTAGPYPLAYHGLGEPFVVVFFGFVATAGTAFVQLGHVPLSVWPAALAVGALATALLVVNNLRDRVSDAASKKRTLAVRFGERFAEREYAACLVTAYAMPLVLAAQVGLTALAPLVSLPLAISLARRVRRERGVELNALLAATARLLVVFGLLLAAGLALSEVS
jgi:1,4-dihydroxy-2-naphthoate polyprenyltransferase